MPNFDGTGPAGMGPMTGRGAGYCAVPGYMYPGWGLRGRGWGRGRGMGWGWRNYAAALGMPVSPAVQENVPVPEDTSEQPSANREQRLAEELRDVKVQVKQLTKVMEAFKQRFDALTENPDETAKE